MTVKLSVTSLHAVEALCLTKMYMSNNIFRFYKVPVLFRVESGTGAM
jgi:hypothetical protein